MKKYKLLWIAAAIILVIILFFLFKGKNKKNGFETQKVTRGDISSAVEGTGNITPKVLVDVGCQVTGRVKKIYVDFNSPVKKGQILAQIDPATYQAQLDQAQAKVASSANNLNALQAQIRQSEFGIKKQKIIVNNKKLDVDRDKTLIAEDLIPKNTYDDDLADYLTTESDLESAKANLEEALANYRKAQADHKSNLAQLDQVKANLSYTDIISPVDGIVISRKISEGQTVVSSFQTSTLFQIAKDLTQMEIHCDINESDIASISEAQETTFTVDAYPGKTFTGKIIQVREEATEIEKTVYYTAVINVENPELLLKPGMTAQVKIVTKSKKDVLRIPNEALRFLPKLPKLQNKLKELHSKKSSLESSGGEISAVAWVLKKGEPVPVEVVLGISDNNFTELVKGNVSENDFVITGEKIGKK